MRIISLLPTATEMLCAIGAQKQIVGRSEHCTFPKSIESVPVVVRSLTAQLVPEQDSQAIHEAVLKLRQANSHQFQIDLPLLQKLQPDLIITQGVCSVCAASHSEVDEAIQKLNPAPQVITLESVDLEGVFSELILLGKATELHPKAQELVKQLRNRLDTVVRKANQAPGRPRVWCCEWLEPLMAAGHWIPELVKSAGGTDGLAEAGANSRWLNWDQVTAYDPEVIMVMPCSYTLKQTGQEIHRLQERSDWEKLSAVQNRRVFGVDADLLHHAGPRLLEGLELFAHLIHPELFEAPKARTFQIFS